MVVVRSFVKKRPAARLTLVLHLTRVDELVSLQGARAVEALVAGFTAEGRHVHRGPVQPVDDPAVPPLSSPPLPDAPVPFSVTRSLVLLQVAVVEKCFPTQVTHERLGGPVEEHVRLQLVVLDEALATNLTGVRLFPRVNAKVPFQVLLEGETRPAGLAREGFASVDRLVRPEGPPHGESLVTHAAFERLLAVVSSPVALQGDGVPETLPTLGAPVRLLHRVDHLVSLQVALCFEGLPAGGARERPEVGVNNLVRL